MLFVLDDFTWQTALSIEMYKDLIIMYIFIIIILRFVAA